MPYENMQSNQRFQITHSCLKFFLEPFTNFVCQFFSLLECMTTSTLIHPSEMEMATETALPWGAMTNAYVELQDQWNGPYFFLLKKYCSAPGEHLVPLYCWKNPKSMIFCSRVPEQLRSRLVIFSDFGLGQPKRHFFDTFFQFWPWRGPECDKNHL